MDDDDEPEAMEDICAVGDFLSFSPTWRSGASIALSTGYPNHHACLTPRE